VERSGPQRDAAEPLQTIADPVAAELEVVLALRRSGSDPKALRRALRRINKLLNSWYTKLAEEAGVRRIISHGARHTAGSTYAVMGARQKVIASLLGRVDTAATERYSHVVGGATAALVEARRTRLRQM
jgi:integrase